MSHTIILGAGISGLTTAHELLKKGQAVTLIEKGSEVGGLARTFNFDGYRFDIGGHRFHSHNPAVVAWLKELLGDDLLTVPRRSHIYLNHQFVKYPIQLPAALTTFPIIQSGQMIISYFVAKFREKQRPDRSFEDWIIKRFGKKMYAVFFQPYTEKVWGMPASQISAQWAAQRIGIPSLGKTIRHALFPPSAPPATAVTQFYYPRCGFGMIATALKNKIRALGGCILTNTTAIQTIPGDPVSVRLKDGGVLLANEVISTIPLPALLSLLPAFTPPTPTLSLSYRGLICVYLALRQPQVSQDSWTYFPDPSLIFGRTHEPKNWSMEMVPNAGNTSLGIEIFATPEDAVWGMTNNNLIEKTVGQLNKLGWLHESNVLNGWVVRNPHAYPIQKVGYETALQSVKENLAIFPWLSLMGRTGSFQYLNSDGVIEEALHFAGKNQPQVSPIPIGRWV